MRIFRKIIRSYRISIPDISYIIDKELPIGVVAIFILFFLSPHSAPGQHEALGGSMTRAIKGTAVRAGNDVIFTLQDYRKVRSKIIYCDSLRMYADKTIEGMSITINKQDSAIIYRDRLIDKQDSIIKNQDSIITDQELQLRHQEKEISLLDREISFFKKGILLISALFLIFFLINNNK